MHRRRCKPRASRRPRDGADLASVRRQVTQPDVGQLGWAKAGRDRIAPRREVGRAVRITCKDVHTVDPARFELMDRCFGIASRPERLP
jgi:hypothetical protein